VPADVRARGDAFGNTRYVTLFARVAVLAGSIAILMFSGAAVSMRNLARRITSRVPLQNAIVALETVASFFLLSLPVDTYAGFVRMRHAGFSHISYASWLGDTAPLNSGI
jgi:hypothetical protein